MILSLRDVNSNSLWGVLGQFQIWRGGMQCRVYGEERDSLGSVVGMIALVRILSVMPLWKHLGDEMNLPK